MLDRMAVGTLPAKHHIALRDPNGTLCIGFPSSALAESVFLASLEPKGQLRMDAPYSHLDFKRPDFLGPCPLDGDDVEMRTLVVKRLNQFHGFRYPASPLDVVGWDGSTDELAVMLDTDSPLHATADAMGIEDSGYQESFNE